MSINFSEVSYKEVELETGYKLDLLVERLVIIEIKSVEALAPVHFAQLLTYLKLSPVKVPNFPIWASTLFI